MVGLLQFIVVLVVLGAIVWAVEQAPFISESIKPVIRWAMIIVILVLVLAFVLGMTSTWTFPTYRR